MPATKPKTKKTNPWLKHVKKIMKSKPALSFKDVLKTAAVSYKKK